MNKHYSICLLPGDGIGPEIMPVATKILDFLQELAILDVSYTQHDFGGIAFDKYNEVFPQETQKAVDTSDAVLLACVGGLKWDKLPKNQKPETGLLSLRKRMGVFANLRPIFITPSLVHKSPLKPEIVENVNIVIIRELTGGIYFGTPRGIDGQGDNRVGINTETYSVAEIQRIARVSFTTAQQRKKLVCSVDKANVLESSMLWREVVEDVAKDYPDVRLEHMYVDNAAMQLIRNPKQFDVMVTNNIFGDILSDLASQITGSIGLLPSASLNQSNKGLYEPIHGSAPDIAGKNLANPAAMAKSLALLFRHSLLRNDLAVQLELAVEKALTMGMPKDLCNGEQKETSCSQVIDNIVFSFKQLFTHT